MANTPKNPNLPSPQYPLTLRAKRAAARAEAKRRKAVVTRVVNDGEFKEVHWVRDNGEVVSGSFKLFEWSRAPQAVTERMLEALAHGPEQVLYPRRAEPVSEASPESVAEKGVTGQPARRVLQLVSRAGPPARSRLAASA